MFARHVCRCMLTAMFARPFPLISCLRRRSSRPVDVAIDFSRGSPVDVAIDFSRFSLVSRVSGWSAGDAEGEGLALAAGLFASGLAAAVVAR
jgi:hypothetical protein